MTQERYSRQILFEDIGEHGQQTINQKHVLIVGMGALGTHVAEGLVRAGIQELTIVDRDYIEYSNLQRQTLFTESDADRMLPKVVAAQDHLRHIRSDIKMHIYIEHVDAQFLEQYATSVDLIIDATDNFETRQLINDFSYRYRIPWIYGGVVQSTYVETAFIPGQTPCFNCLMPQLPVINLTCDTVGVIQPAVTMTTSFQLRDALKILIGKQIPTKLTYGDIWENTHCSFGYSKMRRDDCPTCGKNASFPYLYAHSTSYATLCGRDTVQYENKDITKKVLVDFLTALDIRYHENQYMLVFEFKKHRIVYFEGGRMLIHGTTKKSEAIHLINQLFG